MMWKEAVVARFNVLSRNLPKMTEENHENLVRIIGLQSEIWTLDLPDMKQEC
jgi:hypothetical protein